MQELVLKNKLKTWVFRHKGLSASKVQPQNQGSLLNDEIAQEIRNQQVHHYQHSFNCWQGHNL